MESSDSYRLWWGLTRCILVTYETFFTMHGARTSKTRLDDFLTTSQ